MKYYRIGAGFLTMTALIALSRGASAIDGCADGAIGTSTARLSLSIAWVCKSSGQQSYSLSFGPPADKHLRVRISAEEDAVTSKQAEQINGFIERIRNAGLRSDLKDWMEMSCERLLHGQSSEKEKAKFMKKYFVQVSVAASEGPPPVKLPARKDIPLVHAMESRAQKSESIWER